MSNRAMVRRSSMDKAGLWEWAWRVGVVQVVPGFASLEWTPEFVFLPDRKFRFDYALPALRIAVEVDGGNRKAVVRRRKDGRYYGVVVGAHTQEGDYWKRAHAAASGWLVFAFTPQMLQNDPLAAVSLVCDAIIIRGERGGYG